MITYPRDLERVVAGLERGRYSRAEIIALLQFMAARIVMLENLLDDGVTDEEIAAAVAVARAQLSARERAGPVLRM